MLSKVAFGQMPRDDVLSGSERQQMVAEIISVLWADNADRQEALRYC